MEIVNKFAPIAMAWIMFVVGTTVTLGNFKDILKSPKNLSLGLITQTLIVPIVGVVVAYLSPVSEIYKVGIILVSCVPSAVMSNYLTKSIKGNVALSISLTAVCSLLSFITIPIILGIGLNLINSSEELNLLTLRNASLKIFLMVAIPTIIGVFIKTYLNRLVNKLNKFFDFSSFLLFLLIVFSAAYVEKDILVKGYKDIGIIVFIVFFSILITCKLFLGLFDIDKRDMKCILTENVIQNNALSIIVGGMLFAEYQGFLVLPAVYAIFQYKVFIIYILYRTFKYKQ